MTEIVEPAPDVSFGCTVADVLRLLPHIEVGAPVVVDAEYGPTQVRHLTEADVEGFIQAVGSRVLARIYRYEAVPERTQEHIRTMARDLVATGAAHYVQAAVHPGASNPNDGSSYAAMLWDRFTTDLDDVRATIDRELEDPSDGIPSGGITGFFPPPMFTDDQQY